MAVRRHLEVTVDVLDDVADQRRVLLGHAVADGVGDVQRRGAVAHRQLAHLDEEVDVGAAAVLGRELDVVAVALGPGDGLDRLLLHLLLGHAELLLHVDRRRRDEDVDAGLGRVPHRLPRAVDVLERGARQRRDGRAAHGLADRLDRLEVALAGDREPGLDHVDAEAPELLRDLELLAHVERDARRLLAVPQGRVEDLHVVAHGSASFWCLGSQGWWRLASEARFGQRKTSPALRHEEASASTEAGARSYVRRRLWVRSSFVMNQPCCQMRAARVKHHARIAGDRVRECVGAQDGPTHPRDRPARRIGVRGVAQAALATETGTRWEPSRSPSRRSRRSTTRPGSTPPSRAPARLTIR